MSMNLYCRCIFPGRAFDVDLVQTPTNVTYEILGSGTPWQDVIRRYLAWVKTIDAELYKRERSRMGRIWYDAENLGGRVIFTAG